MQKSQLQSQSNNSWKQIIKRTFSAFISADYIDHFIELYIDKWVRHLTLCIDNARICKNQYPVAWTMELVESKRFDTVRFVHLTVGHTKFAPDNLFASIAKTFYNSDVFCIKMLDHIIQQYATSLILHTQADEALEKNPWNRNIQLFQELLKCLTSLWS